MGTTRFRDTYTGGAGSPFAKPHRSQRPPTGMATTATCGFHSPAPKRWYASLCDFAAGARQMQNLTLNVTIEADALAWAMICTAVVTFITLWFIPAPYGRHADSAFGPPINAKLAWIVQECPTLVVTALMYRGADPACMARPANRALVAMYLVHYVHRTLIFPLRLRGGKPSPLSVPILAFMFTTYNTYMQMTYLMHGHQYADEWLQTPQFVCGACVFACGMAANIHADSVLINLRRPGETGYKIPHGGLFRLVTGANFLGEIFEWGGWALAQCSLPGAAFFLYTAANLIPRARSHHQWYLDKFKDEYPGLGRSAVVPGLL